MEKKACIRVAMTFLLLGFLVSGAAFAAEPLQVVRVTATIVDQTVVAGIPSGDEGATRNVGALPEDLSSYAPMPFPELPSAGSQTVDEAVMNSVVVYNPTSGEEKVLDPAALSGQFGPILETIASLGREGSGSSEIDAEHQSQDSLATFTNMTAVGNTHEYPWRVLTKLFMTFPDGRYVCSGTMIKPGYAITAGHCVNQGGGKPWASAIQVVPGYRNDWAPYGVANAVSMLAFVGWVTHGNIDWDIGVIKLDRNIGSAVGWHGFGYTTDKNWYLSTLFNNGGYPAESAYGFTGRTLYYRYGYNDGWVAGAPHHVYFWKPSYGGHSGSSEYVYYSGSGRYVYSILSTSNRSTFTTCATMDGDQFNAIRNWTAASAPASVDLTPLFVSAKALGANDGRQMEMNYLAHNTASSAWSGTVYANVYLSDNENISTSDTLVQRHAFEAAFDPWSTVEVTVPLVSLPESVAPGSYYLGVILDLEDANRMNNDSDGQDAGRVVIVN